ncbi:septum formation inhibitor Maf, partial [Psychroserpens sp.]|uniref:septum formation inhibitor Maf n=1 Tax=Psychroserpens sp. TaxID=2020870 RepID=UPI003C78B1EC
MKTPVNVVFIFFFFGILTSCNESNSAKDQGMLSDHVSEDIVKQDSNTTQKFNPSDAFKSYWYAGQAEISSYKLEQARYGEMREGTAVLIYVTEDFLPKEQVKADNFNKANIPILKLNTTKNFNTGIYPYAIMESTFFPIVNNQYAIKLSSSVQEWCGQTYTQLNNRDQFEIKVHSYFEGEGDKDFSLDKAILENELWTQLRLDPKSLPLGELEVIPSMAYIQLKHIELKAYKAIATLNSGAYTLSYPDLKRDLTMYYNTNFPYEILSWEETYNDGYGSNAARLTTKATRLKTIKSP